MSMILECSRVGLGMPMGRVAYSYEPPWENREEPPWDNRERERYSPSGGPSEASRLNQPHEYDWKTTNWWLAAAAVICAVGLGVLTAAFGPDLVRLLKK